MFDLSFEIFLVFYETYLAGNISCKSCTQELVCGMCQRFHLLSFRQGRAEGRFSIAILVFALCKDEKLAKSIY